jgi:hypothetical protein
MSLILDPEVAEAMASRGEAMAGMTPPVVGGRGARWEPILDASGKAQPIPEDVTTHDYVAATDDGAEITMRWYARNDPPCCSSTAAAIFRPHRALRRPRCPVRLGERRTHALRRAPEHPT